MNTETSGIAPDRFAGPCIQPDASLAIQTEGIQPVATCLPMDFGKGMRLRSIRKHIQEALYRALENPVPSLVTRVKTYGDRSQDSTLP